MHERMIGSCDNIWIDTQVSYFPHMTTSAEKFMPLLDVLNMIRTDVFKKRIIELRRYKSAGNNENATAIKSNLPAVTFCATFKGRRLSSAYSHYNNLL